MSTGGLNQRVVSPCIYYLRFSCDAVSADDLPDCVDLLEVRELSHHVLDGAEVQRKKHLLFAFFAKNWRLFWCPDGATCVYSLVPDVHVEELVQVLVVAADLQVVVPPHHTLRRMQLQWLQFLCQQPNSPTRSFTCLLRDAFTD